MCSVIGSIIVSIPPVTRVADRLPCEYTRPRPFAALAAVQGEMLQAERFQPRAGAVAPLGSPCAAQQALPSSRWLIQIRGSGNKLRHTVAGTAAACPVASLWVR